MPKDEIPVCNCRPEVMRAPPQPRPSSAGPPLSPTKRQSVIALASDLACHRLARPGSAPAASSPTLPLPQILSCEDSAAAAAGPIPQPDVAADLATDLATSAPQAPAEADGAQLLAEEQPRQDPQVLGPALSSGTPETLPALAEVPAPPAQSDEPTAAPAGSEPDSAVPVVPAQPVASQSTTAVRTGCGENCLNRLSYIHCDPRLCPCGLSCSNR